MPQFPGSHHLLFRRGICPSEYSLLWGPWVVRVSAVVGRLIGAGGRQCRRGWAPSVRLLPPRDGHVVEGLLAMVRKIKAKLVLQFRNQGLSGRAISSGQGMSVGGHRKMPTGGQ